jgi:hypothetical protein
METLKNAAATPISYGETDIGIADDSLGKNSDDSGEFDHKNSSLGNKKQNLPKTYINQIVEE